MPSSDADLNTVARFLARRDELEPVDLIVLLGSSLLVTAKAAAEALDQGLADEILVSGGIGHSTPWLYESVRGCPDLNSIPVDGRPEAEIIADVLTVRHGVPAEKILIENRSTNCGSNALECKRLLADLGRSPRSLLLIQDPTMQRRTHASFERSWRGEAAPQFISHAPFVPEMVDGVLHPEDQWPFERFLSLLLGEIPRLQDAPAGYGPKGRDFIEHVDIPREVMDAHARVSTT
ncbi:YdcF family protein [Fimbriimonas ginsengisoli]|uniref:DUF218 domain-containing protein n=1 Tax=Fimbriimonas ginsengisoli Gsoil 348 TaxID=661478 RepID=A0A068NVS8_FIMGI|nr:YdcF family protein [Fimbriimonas ginsengisoli]AIE86895.1 hypothetical protein OP10G_3527 [Fimbriimonas ginsengisoli Gsoil 348]